MTKTMSNNNRGFKALISLMAVSALFVFSACMENDVVSPKGEPELRAISLDCIEWPDVKPFLKSNGNCKCPNAATQGCTKTPLCKSRVGEIVFVIEDDYLVVEVSSNYGKKLNNAGISWGTCEDLTDFFAAGFLNGGGNSTNHWDKNLNNSKVQNRVGHVADGAGYPLAEHRKWAGPKDKKGNHTETAVKFFIPLADLEPQEYYFTIFCSEGWAWGDVVGPSGSTGNSIRNNGLIFKVRINNCEPTPKLCDCCGQEATTTHTNYSGIKLPWCGNTATCAPCFFQDCLELCCTKDHCGPGKKCYQAVRDKFISSQRFRDYGFHDNSPFGNRSKEELAKLVTNGNKYTDLSFQSGSNPLDNEELIRYYFWSIVDKYAELGDNSAYVQFRDMVDQCREEVQNNNCAFWIALHQYLTSNNGSTIAIEHVKDLALEAGAGICNPCGGLVCECTCDEVCMTTDQQGYYIHATGPEKGLRINAWDQALNNGNGGWAPAHSDHIYVFFHARGDLGIQGRMMYVQRIYSVPQNTNPAHGFSTSQPGYGEGYPVINWHSWYFMNHPDYNLEGIACPIKKTYGGAIYNNAWGIPYNTHVANGEWEYVDACRNFTTAGGFPSDETVIYINSSEHGGNNNYVNKKNREITKTIHLQPRARLK